MKPLPGDHRHRLLIQGSELKALQSLTWAMAEAFSLDRKIENYKGTRPLTLYRWDLECLMDVIDMALKREPDRRSRSKPPDPAALKSLAERLHQEYDAVYGHENAVAQQGKSRQVRKKSAKRKSPQDAVCQFKITLQESHSPIWRRIQVRDCTLDKLHEHIQTAMGWTNSHLHHFKLGEQLYGDPDLMKENFEEMEYKDSTTTKISDILPKTGKRFRFQYEYDFGDSWYHEVLFESIVRAESKVKYPHCLGGARACPPEDCGGIWGYGDFVEAIQNPSNERHEELLEWVGGKFDPEKFDPAKATKAMRKGLPDWRRMAGW